MPESEVGHLDLPFEASNSIKEELQMAEDATFKQDALLPTRELEANSGENPPIHHSIPVAEAHMSSQCSDEMLLKSESLGEIYGPLKDINDLPSSPPPRRLPVQDLKVEVPLLPAEIEHIAPWQKKHVSFSDSSIQLIPDLPTLIPASDSNGEEDINTFFEQNIAPIAVKAERAIEQEQLQEADTTHRVNVPILDFSRAKAPWDADALQSGTDTYFDHSTEILDNLKDLQQRQQYWPLNGGAERELQWMAFPAALAYSAVQESIEDDGSTAEFVKQPKFLDPETLIWKPKGLHIVDEHENSDEKDLEVANFPHGKDFEWLLRKRKLEIDNDVKESSHPLRKLSRSSTFTTLHYGPNSGDGDRMNSQNNSAKSKSHCDKSQTLFDSDFSTLDALSTFMAVRKGTFKAAKGNIEADVKNIRLKQQRTKQTNHPVLGKLQQTDAAGHLRLVSNSVLMPSPEVKLADEPRCFIFSMALLGNRKLTRQILTLDPSAEIVERDLSVQHPTAKPLWASRTKTHLGPTDGMAIEADLIISPGVGLLWTTVQKVKQRSLPGQVTHSALRDQIALAAPLYERFIVLVSQGLSYQDSGHVQPNQSDCEALADFMNYCSSLSEDIEIIFTSGGEAELARWITAMMSKYSVPSGMVPIAQEETAREMFLRRVGLNAYAAQAILLGLGTALDDPVSGDASGLSRFAQMSLQEKLARFETLFGGRRLLSRVHQVLDARW